MPTSPSPTGAKCGKVLKQPGSLGQPQGGSINIGFHRFFNRKAARTLTSAPSNPASRGNEAPSSRSSVSCSSRASPFPWEMGFVTRRRRAQCSANQKSRDGKGQAKQSHRDSTGNGAPPSKYITVLTTFCHILCSSSQRFQHFYLQNAPSQWHDNAPVELV